MTIFHVAVGDSGVYDFKSKDIAAMIIKQINPDNLATIPPTALEIRLQKVRAWNLTGKTLNLVTFDYISRATTTTTLATCIDLGNPTTYPAVGYEWPTTHQQTVLNSTNTLNLFTIVSGASNQCVVYINVFWRLYGIPKPQLTIDVLSRICADLQKVEENAEGIVKQTTETNQHLISIKESQPGLVSKIVNGVAHIGAYVAPLAADELTLQTLKDLQESVNKLSLMSSRESLEIL